MSLICVKCNKIIVMSGNPDHYAICAACPLDLTEEEKAKIEAYKPHRNRD